MKMAGPRFFIDNNLSQSLANGLKGFGENVIHLQEEFPEDEQDASWLKFIGEKGFFLITRDDRIRYHPNELQALNSTGVARSTSVANSARAAI